MKIGARAVGRDHPVLVIAEIGVNHDGSVERAIELVNIAVSSGADAVKLQVFSADRLLHRSARFAEYQVDRTDASDPAAMLSQYQLSDESLERIVREIKRAGLIPIATPFSPEDVARVKAIGVQAIKIASPDLVNKVLIEEVAMTGLPVIFSTGAADKSEIAQAAQWIQTKISSFALLHCISSYPTSLEDASLGWITQLLQFNVPVGYSDHTNELLAGALALAYGSSIIEKHLTYDSSAAGPDHSASFDGPNFSKYVDMIRTAEKMSGRGMREVMQCEQDVRSVSRQSLVLKVALNQGETITRPMLTSQRPGTGISSWRLDEIVGKRAAADIPAGEMLQPEMIEDYHA